MLLLTPSHPHKMQVWRLVAVCLTCFYIHGNALGIYSRVYSLQMRVVAHNPTLSKLQVRRLIAVCLTRFYIHGDALGIYSRVYSLQSALNTHEQSSRGSTWQSLLRAGGGAGSDKGGGGGEAGGLSDVSGMFS